MPELISRISSSSALASPEPALASTILSISEPSPVRTTRPYVPGSSSTAVTTVAAAPLSAWVASRSAINPAETSGTSPESTTTVSESATTSAAARRAPPVPFASGCGIASIPSGNAPEMSRSGETITAIRPAPASRAASIGQATRARPQTG